VAGTSDSAQGWYRDLFRIESRRLSTLAFARVVLAVGLPMGGLTLGGHLVAAVAGGATALFVTMSDIGTTRRDRIGNMLATAALMVVGGWVGHTFGRSTGADELVVLASALVAGWVSNSHPGISAAMRFGALATAAGVGFQATDSLTALAVAGGAACAIGVALAFWRTFGIPADENVMDWRVGIRRAFAGADAGPRFAVCYAGAAAAALLAAEWLGVHNAYWATLTVLMVMRREGTRRLGLVLHYMAGTLAGIPIAWALVQVAGAPLVIATLATVAAACGRLGFALNPALGFSAFTVFLVMAVDLASHGELATAQVLGTRFYDVAIGCALALVGMLLAGFGRGADDVPPPAR
jgi:hypothetical protein